MNKFYTVLTAAAVAAGFSASAQVADLQINESLKEYAPAVTAKLVSSNVITNVEANPSRADHWCTGAMYHYNNSFFRLDQFELAVDRANEGEDVVYTVHGMYPTMNNPQGSSVNFIIHPNGTISVPVQEGPYIPDFWSFAAGAPEGLSGYAYICDIATANTAMASELGTLTTASQELLEQTSFYDAETGLAHLMMFTFFQYDGMELRNGTVVDTLYPFDFLLPYPDDYNAFRSESLQLGDWGNTMEVDYTDSFLPRLGFEVETYKVVMQQNTLFDATYRMVHPFINNTQLLADDFIDNGAGDPIDAAMLIYSFGEDEFFVGRTYSGLHVNGSTPAEFEFESYINYQLTYGASKEEVTSLNGIVNGDNIVYNGKPFGKLENGFLTIPEYCNLMAGLSEYSDTQTGFSMYLPDNDPYFVINNFFKLQWPYGGVEAVVADNTNAPVEYYNLQGIRVNSPKAGNVYIRRQGTEAAKVIL